MMFVPLSGPNSEPFPSGSRTAGGPVRSLPQRLKVLIRPEELLNLLKDQTEALVPVLVLASAAHELDSGSAPGHGKKGSKRRLLLHM